MTNLNVIPETYLKIDTNEVCNKAQSVLNKLGVDAEIAYQRKVGSIHQVIYNLKDFHIDSLEDGGLLPRIMFTNSYNKESAFMIAVGLLRGICTNGLVFGQSFFSEKIIHRVGPTADEKLVQLETKIGNAVNIIGEITDHVEEMRSLQISEADWINVVGNLNVGGRTKDYAIRQKLNANLRPEDSGNNAWALYNVVNESLRKTTTALQYTKQNARLMDDVIILTQDVAKAA